MITDTLRQNSLEATSERSDAFVGPMPGSKEVPVRRTTMDKQEMRDGFVATEWVVVERCILEV